MTDEELFGQEDGIETDGQNPEESTSPESESKQQAKTASPGKQPKEQPVNWQEQPEFKAWQSKYEKRIQESQREADQMRNAMAQYEQQLDQLSTRDLDEGGKLAYENQKLKRLLGTLQQRQAEMEGKQRIFNRIQSATSRAGFAIPMDVLSEAQDADDAWERALGHIYANLQENTAKTVAERLEKREANQVDLGGGSVASDGSDLQSRYDRAMKSFNTSVVLDIMNEADSKGVRLKL